MRNGVLSVIGEIIVKVLSKEDLDPNLKNTRDKFLDRLEVLLFSSLLLALFWKEFRQMLNFCTAWYLEFD